MPYFCISCNLSQGQEVVHRDGLLWEAIRASMAIPGIFAPVLHNSELLVDGGATNNFPIDVMRAIYERDGHRHRRQPRGLQGGEVRYWPRHIGMAGSVEETQLT